MVRITIHSAPKLKPATTISEINRREARVMSLQDEITKAVGAHGVWKMRLRTAIDTGKADANAADVAKDNACAFGQWLYGPAIPAAARTNDDYITVRKLHAEFHQCAAKVIECVCHGHKVKCMP